jgi:hypothetical protein
MAGFLVLIPSISIVSLALLSVFTVGYFSKIGLHFLGLVDVSNLVYSFGLSFGLISTIVVFINGDTFRGLKAFALNQHFLPAVVKAWTFVFLPCLVIVMIAYNATPQRFVPSFISMDFVAFVFILCAAIMLLIIVYTRHVAEDQVIGSEIAGFAVALVVAIFLGGRYQAGKEVFSVEKMYDISLRVKGPQPEGSVSELKDVRIVRSSSSGFIIAIDGFVSFLPKDEVAMVQAQKSVVR